MYVFMEELAATVLFAGSSYNKWNAVLVLRRIQKLTRMIQSVTRWR